MTTGSDDRLHEHALWLVRLRWAAVAATGGAIVVASATGLLGPGALERMAACLAGLAAANVLFGMRLRRGARPHRVLAVQIGVDLVALTLLLHESGGVANPLHVIYVFHVLIAAIVFERRAAWIVSGAASATFAALAFAEVRGLVSRVPLGREPAGAASDPVPVALEVAAFALVALCTTWLTRLVVERGRAAEQALAEAAREAIAERKRLVAVVTGAEVGMRLLSKDRTIVWQNRNVEEWFQSSGFEGRKCLSAFGQPVLGCTSCFCEQVVSTGKVAQGERQAGSRRFSVTATPILDEHGAVDQVVECIRDVTDERETAAQLVQAAKLTAIGELAASVAHEVNNPTGVIIGKVRLLLSNWRADLPEHAVAELEKVDRQARRIADATQRLLDFARPGQGALRESIDVNAAVDDCLALTEHRLDRGSVRLESVRAPDLPRVSADSKGLRLALLNVLNNAVDAMPEGGVLTVATGAAPDGRVSVEVRDTGCGIAPENLDRIFDPFFSTKGPKGTGLGLAITRRILREHGGEVEVASEPGRGSRFNLLLVPGRKP